MRLAPSQFLEPLGILKPFGIAILVGVAPAQADMRVAISGAAAILPLGFTPRDGLLRPVLPDEPEPSIAEPSIREPSIAEAPVWTRPMTDRQPDATEKASDLAPDLVDAILRIESIYDPTRVDAFGEAARLEVRAGTASMNNVFADRWHFADTDPNVHYSVRYLAQAWMKNGDAPCDAFTKNRASDGGPALSALSVTDCRRITRLRTDHEETVTRITIAGAPVAVPVFAAPLPGARLSSGDFWAAQKARIQAIQARLRDKWRAGGTATAAR